MLQDGASSWIFKFLSSELGTMTMFWHLHCDIIRLIEWAGGGGRGVAATLFTAR